ncbi:hypothetical protein BIZ78_gp215 [Erwinia phage vB_EamM_Caitlin]|uniref:hypothetical protein n=1 Tax=Erwinia phage vB_EamM_Caitlin TaxID=1883379 RepID=UPI00081D1B73|nr:hypothetical protein BIZ78_gp215 [Erwinia phage vB_EamM_Caitlin]ANZ48360.1 hypothetical protein CAITLIN_65 [Erwinia phage vB_EamM_Caitlin]
MRYSLDDLASVVRQTMPFPAFDLTFKSSVNRHIVHTIPEPIMVAFAIIITHAYRSCSAHTLTYGQHEFHCPALDYDDYLRLKDAWQWLSKDDYTLFNKVHSADFSKQEYFFREKNARVSAMFNGCEVYMVIPTLAAREVHGAVLVRQTQVCDTLLDFPSPVKMHLPHSGADIVLKAPMSYITRKEA